MAKNIGSLKKETDVLSFHPVLISFDVRYDNCGSDKRKIWLSFKLQSSCVIENRRFASSYPKERFQMTSRPLYWCFKTNKRRPYWCTKPIIRELNSIFMQTFSFVSVNQYGRWPREGKRSIFVIPAALP